MYRFLVLFLFLIPMSLHASVDRDISNSCIGFEEVVKKLNCEKPTFLEKTEIPLCYQFLKHQNKFSPNGQSVLTDIRICLQTNLLNSKELSCLNEEDKAINDHVVCFINSGYCKLSLLDRIRISVIAQRETLNPKALSAFFQIAKYCYF